MSDAPVTAKGTNVTVTFDGRMLKVTRRTSRGMTDKQIPVRSITAVEWRPPRLGRQGRINFVVPGDDDDNDAHFLKKATDDFEAVRDAVNAALSS